MRLVGASDRFGGAAGNDLAAALTALRAEVDDVVGVFTRSSSCSTTTTLLPLSTSRCNTSISLRSSALWSPVVGSSSR